MERTSKVMPISEACSVAGALLLKNCNCRSAGL